MQYSIRRLPSPGVPPPPQQQQPPPASRPHTLRHSPPASSMPISAAPVSAAPSEGVNASDAASSLAASKPLPVPAPTSALSPARKPASTPRRLVITNPSSSMLASSSDLFPDFVFSPSPVTAASPANGSRTPLALLPHSDSANANANANGGLHNNSTNNNSSSASGLDQRATVSRSKSTREPRRNNSAVVAPSTGVPSFAPSHNRSRSHGTSSDLASHVKPTTTAADSTEPAPTIGADKSKAAQLGQQPVRSATAFAPTPAPSYAKQLPRHRFASSATLSDLSGFTQLTAPSVANISDLSDFSAQQSLGKALSDVSPQDMAKQRHQQRQSRHGRSSSLSMNSSHNSSNGRSCSPDVAGSSSRRDNHPATASAPQFCVTPSPLPPSPSPSPPSPQPPLPPPDIYKPAPLMLFQARPTVVTTASMSVPWKPSVPPSKQATSDQLRVDLPVHDDTTSLATLHHADQSILASAATLASVDQQPATASSMNSAHLPRLLSVQSVPMDLVSDAEQRMDTDLPADARHEQAPIKPSQQEQTHEERQEHQQQQRLGQASAEQTVHAGTLMRRSTSSDASYQSGATLNRSAGSITIKRALLLAQQQQDQDKLNRLAAEKSALETELDDAHRMRAKALADNERLQKALDELKAHSGQHMLDSRDEIQDAHAQLVSLAREMAVLKHENRTLRSAKDKAEQDAHHKRERLKKTIVELQASVSSQTEDIRRLKRENRELVTRNLLIETERFSYELEQSVAAEGAADTSVISEADKSTASVRTDIVRSATRPRHRSKGSLDSLMPPVSLRRAPPPPNMLTLNTSKSVSPSVPDPFLPSPINPLRILDDVFGSEADQAHADLRRTSSDQSMATQTRGTQVHLFTPIMVDRATQFEDREQAPRKRVLETVAHIERMLVPAESQTAPSPKQVSTATETACLVMCDQETQADTVLSADRLDPPADGSSEAVRSGVSAVLQADKACETDDTVQRDLAVSSDEELQEMRSKYDELSKIARDMTTYMDEQADTIAELGTLRTKLQDENRRLADEVKAFELLLRRKFTRAHQHHDDDADLESEKDRRIAELEDEVRALSMYVTKLLAKLMANDQLEAVETQSKSDCDSASSSLSRNESSRSIGAMDVAVISSTPNQLSGATGPRRCSHCTSTQSSPSGFHTPMSNPSLSYNAPSTTSLFSQLQQNLTKFVVLSSDSIIDRFAMPSRRPSIDRQQQEQPQPQQQQSHMQEGSTDASFVSTAIVTGAATPAAPTPGTATPAESAVSHAPQRSLFQSMIPPWETPAARSSAIPESVPMSVTASLDGIHRQQRTQYDNYRMQVMEPATTASSATQSSGAPTSTQSAQSTVAPSHTGSPSHIKASSMAARGHLALAPIDTTNATTAGQSNKQQAAVDAAFTRDCFSAPLAYEHLPLPQDYAWLEALHSRLKEVADSQQDDPSLE
ncbi:hypothetical protein BC831DRAFT_433649 [Entophlyctis helioformis]|nr:hypothetical protein BC831DRAFT_433649 [Entophlyctis helioformis]